MKKKAMLITLLTVSVIGSICLILFILTDNKEIKTEGISLKYRVYTDDGWSEWYKNGQEAGDINKSIKAVEASVDSKKTGHILYNIYSQSENFDSNDTYDGDTAGNKKDSIYGIKFFLTDKLFEDYVIYYRTYNKKDGWLDWTSSYEISGDNEVDIEKIQIKILKTGDKNPEPNEKTSIGF